MPGEPDDAVAEAVAKALREFDLSEANAGLLTDEEFRGFYHNAARAAIAAARPLIEREAWRPIETAPRDGTEVLVWREDCGILLARWTSAAEFLTDRELEQWDDESAHKEDWFAADFVSGCRLEGECAPTHWMPLPAPPALASSEQGEEG